MSSADLSNSKKDRRVHSLRSRQENEETDKLRHMVEQQTDFIRMQRLEVKMLQEKVTGDARWSWRLPSMNLE